MRLVYGLDAPVAHWVASQIPHGNVLPTFGGSFTAVGMATGDTLIGGVVWHNHSSAQQRIEVSGATISTQGLTPAIISEVLRYPFDQLKVRRISAEVPTFRLAATRFLRRLGFQQEGLIREGAGEGVDLTLWGLLASEWQASKYFRPHRPPPEVQAVA